MLLGQDLQNQAQELQHYWLQSQTQAEYSQNTGALNTQLNQWVMVLEDLQIKRLGKPLGTPDGTAPTVGIPKPFCWLPCRDFWTLIRAASEKIQSEANALNETVHFTSNDGD